MRLIAKVVPSLISFHLALTVCAAPSVSSFSPAQGRPGVQVVINGLEFTSATKVEFNGVPADFTVEAVNRIHATVPADATSGKIRVSVSASVFGESGSSFAVAPRITDINPSRSATNIFVTINGFNFLGATQVLFSNNKTSLFFVTAATQIRAQVPFGATNGPIAVSTPAGVAVTTNDFVVTGSAPIIDDFSPTIGGPGTMVQISGANFTNVTSVKFGNANAPFSNPAETQINTRVPDNLTSEMAVKISVTASALTTVSSNDFLVIRRPVITNFFPAIGKAGQTQVTIEGLNLGPTNGVTGIGIAGIRLTAWGFNAANQLSVTVPASATNATIGPVTVTNSFGVGVSSNDFNITKAPVIIGFDPALAAPGSNVRIDGFNFIGVPNPSGVKFNGKNAALVAVTADTQLHVEVPAGATTGLISVSNSFGSATSTEEFTVIGNAPFVTGFSPGFGPRGTRITISGKNFFGPLTVKFNGAVDATTTNAPSLTQFDAIVPATATTGPITVTTTAGTSTNANIFYLPPRLTSFVPTNGIVGTNVVITGANFVGVTDVLFNTGAATFSVNASNRLTAVVPTNATTGLLTILTPGGVIISTAGFRVLPHISAFSPLLGPVGTVVTINGTSFFNVNSVSFNNINAPFTNVSSTEIRAIVPITAGTGPIRVSTPDGTAVSATNFTVTMPSQLAVLLSASATLLKPGEPLTYTLVVTNFGPSIVTGATVTNTLPPGVNLVSATSTRGTISPNGRDLSLNIGNFTNDTDVVIVIDVAPIGEGIFVDTASVHSIEPDIVPGDNTASVTTVVVSDTSRTLGINRPAGGSNVVVSWPTSAVSFTLQILNSLSSTNPWAPVFIPPTVVNGRNTVTNPVSGGTGFFRLQRP